MTKTIIKEIGIVILLLIAVSLILAIIFYDYIPNNKTVPVKIQAYNIPEDIKQELEASVLNEQNIVRTYYIDSSDLDLYESTNDYDKGKANPFADYTENTATNSTNSTVNNSTVTNGNTIQSNNAETSDHEDTTKNEVYMNTPGKNY